MKYQIGEETHIVIYIEYQDRIPHSVITKHFVSTAVEPYWRFEYWDVFANDGDTNDLRIYKSGSGGDTLPAPQYIDGCKDGRYWLADGHELTGEPRNAQKLKYPFLLIGYENSKNPFKVAEITHSYEYCDRCGHASTEFCYEHKYDDDEGNARYIDDNSSAE